MDLTEQLVNVGACSIHLVGTIPGFTPDGARVTATLATSQPSLIALGIPADDLPGLAILAAGESPESLIDASEKRLPRGVGPQGGELPASSPLHPTVREALPDDGDAGRFAGLDLATAHLLHLLTRFGPTGPVPSDLVAAQRAATASSIPMVAIDLDDAAHTERVTKELGMLGLLGRSRADRAVLKQTFPDAATAHDLAIRFDAVRCRAKGLRRVEEAREAEMAARLTELAARNASILAVVPVVRLAGIVRRLGAGAQP
ncbi:MAG: hypothetical protein AABX89_05600 [Candidatus Thermoplasmatota archaeon]